jgi:putative hydrolase of the HAD superfamily
MSTVLILPGEYDSELVDAWESGGEDGAHVDHATDDLTAFLGGITGRI